MDVAADFKTRSVAEQGSVFFRILFLVFVLLAFVGTEPFNDLTRVDLRDVDTEGSILRQALVSGTFLLLTAYYFLRNRLFSLLGSLSALHWMLIGWIFLSAFWSLVPVLSLKRATLTWMAFFTILMFMDLFGPKGTIQLLTKILAALCVISFISGFVIPTALHLPGEPPEIVGAWRGVFPHKNNAGFLAVVAFLLTLHQFRLTSHRGLLLVMLVELAFLALTESKTSIALLVVSLSLFVLLSLLTRKRSGRLLFLAIVSYVLLASLIIGLGFSAEIHAFLTNPSSLTNRVYIWNIVREVWNKSPLFGIGFQSLWNVSEQSSYIAPLLYGERLAASQSHNGYLDIAVTTGWIGLFLTLGAFVAVPFSRLLVAFRKEPDKRQHILVTTLYSTTLMHNFMESSLLRNFQYSWILCIIFHIALIQKKPFKNKI